MNNNEDKPMRHIHNAVAEKFYHGTKANLNHGDLIEPGFNSNYGNRNKASYVYLTATLDAATWGAKKKLGSTNVGISV